MTPFERFEQERQELVAQYVERLNQDAKRLSRILKAVTITSVIVAVVIAVILLLFGGAGK